MPASRARSRRSSSRVFRQTGGCGRHRRRRPSAVRLKRAETRRGNGPRRCRCESSELMRRYTLLIDADDTLWENNVFYEKLIEDFVTVVEPYGYTRAYIRHILNETERKNIRQYGYGVRSFGRSLEETYLKLADQMARREMLARSEEHTSELQSLTNLVCRL